MTKWEQAKTIRESIYQLLWEYEKQGEGNLTDAEVCELKHLRSCEQEILRVCESLRS